eukprot:6492674-Amphidinium_carterae.1
MDASGSSGSERFLGLSFDSSSEPIFSIFSSSLVSMALHCEQSTISATLAASLASIWLVRMISDCRKPSVTWAVIVAFGGATAGRPGGGVVTLTVALG